MAETMERDVAKHLEYFGYEVQKQADGWHSAVHPVRLNIHFWPYDLGVRLHCALLIGNHAADRSAWLEFVNRANESSTLARFAFARDNEGIYCVRVRALLPATYNRQLFGLLLDAWNEDLGLFRLAPRENADETDDEQAGEKPAAIVN